MEDVKRSVELGQKHLISRDEAAELGAVDLVFFSHYFFPNAMRQQSSDFHRMMFSMLSSYNHRLVNLQVFRGGAKTTILRILAAHRIAYGLAHTIVYIGKSEKHALRSTNWIRKQILTNRTYAETFGLSKGKQFTDEEAEIIHGVDKYPIWIMAAGITGSIRGINRDDFRPDLIIIDDVQNEENSATTEQREKIDDLIVGALKNSLAPVSEAEHAKIAMLQTPLHKEDSSSRAFKDPEWASLKVGCWTPETMDSPLELQESIWPQRFSSEVWRKEKEAAMYRNKLHLWNREMECRITSPETAAFRKDWLKTYELAPEGMTVVIAIDPVPPPSEIQIAKGFRGKDYEVFSVVGRKNGDFYLLAYRFKRGHDPDWTIMTFFELMQKYRPRKFIVEAVAYQRTLAWLLRKAMQQQRRYAVVDELVDRRKKYDKIVDGLQGVASAGRLYIHDSMTDFVTQFNDYPDVSHDDILDATAVAVSDLYNAEMFEEEDDDSYQNVIPALNYVRSAP